MGRIKHSNEYQIYQTRRQISNKKYLVELLVRSNPWAANPVHMVNIFNKNNRNHWEYITGEEFDFYDKEKARERYKFVIENFQECLMEGML